MVVSLISQMEKRRPQRLSSLSRSCTLAGLALAGGWGWEEGLVGKAGELYCSGSVRGPWYLDAWEPPCSSVRRKISALGETVALSQAKPERLGGRGRAPWRESSSMHFLQNHGADTSAGGRCGLLFSVLVPSQWAP